MLSQNEKLKLHEYLQEQPERGDIIPGINGIRKVRFAAGGKGKRGGARIIYYYHVSDSEIFLIKAYAKSKKEDLSSAEKKDLRNFVNQLKEI